MSAPPPAATSGQAAVTPPPATGGSVLIGDIPGTPRFDPKPTLEALKPSLVDCFRRARASNPSLHGKLTLRIVVGESGRVVSVEANPGGTANDAALVACIGGALKDGAEFQKPGGTATVVAPLVFRR